jgi:hypothetical protein
MNTYGLAKENESKEKEIIAEILKKKNHEYPHRLKNKNKDYPRIIHI